MRDVVRGERCVEGGLHPMPADAHIRRPLSMAASPDDDTHRGVCEGIASDATGIRVRVSQDTPSSKDLKLQLGRLEDSVRRELRGLCLRTVVLVGRTQTSVELARDVWNSNSWGVAHLPDWFGRATFRFTLSEG